MPQSICSVALNEILAAEMRAQPRMFFFQAEPNAELDALLAPLDKDRIRASTAETPFSASALLGAAAGACRLGHPVLVCGSSALLDGLTPALLRSVEGASAPLVIRVLCDENERLDHRPDLPTEWMLAAPSTPGDAAGLLRFALKNPQPSVLIESRILQESRGDIPVRALVKPGQGTVRRKGTELTMVTLGALSEEIISVSETSSAEVIDLRTLQPIDVELVVKSLQKTGRLILCPQSNLLSGFVEPLMREIHAQAFDELDAPIRVFDGLTQHKAAWREELKQQLLITNELHERLATL